MKKLILFSVALFYFSCAKKNDDFNNLCIVDYDKGGLSTFKTNNGNFKCTAGFTKRKDSIDYLHFLSIIQSGNGCYYNASLDIYNISFILDTINLKSDTRVFFKFRDHDDATKENYLLQDEKKYKSWIKLDSINKDTTVIYGKFNLGLYLSNQKFNPNSPDTLYVKDGEFRAVLF